MKKQITETEMLQAIGNTLFEMEGTPQFDLRLDCGIAVTKNVMEIKYAGQTFLLLIHKV